MFFDCFFQAGPRFGTLVCRPQAVKHLRLYLLPSFYSLPQKELFYKQKKRLTARLMCLSI
ncbi:hypothetical protein AZ46_0204005 [Metabacillus indicus LMG 22858]|uniref:Uncharacterized protein n=1 Tax=Metabacillus indicus TaxID=246786 RepID=A0A084H383_METID|nr:hypothetical protein AZ46_0204005 [Metabacillus indicus LMG 22858]KEZ54045.1 hypothetical protein GS18_0203725 [Metabacillus indicus]